MLPRSRLELHLSCPEGREREAAIQLAAEMPAPSWKILAALAAEVVSIHESRSAGATTVVIAPASALADIAREIGFPGGLPD